ncbi:amidohydrolase [Homoserinibacter sp. GY 40078]|uniref:amidohydrolase n=1 Tax=Homoserinibacter sp. GY 40078 TaxID=2603275 RepID=UPI0011C9A926|nr:amidohydrolase family protein [Homoserinibacter sp. GY 40078]TXK19668.1 amidohydrolase family protein [Homoserinibacter sp. GY 40078]
MSAPLLLAGVRLVGADATASEPADVLLRQGRIARIGRALDADGARRVELDGRFLAPGMRDGHVHFDQWAALSRRLDVSAATSAAHAARLVRDRIDAGWPAGEVLVGSGFRDALWADEPSAELLEFGGIPVALISGDVHTVWANRALLARMGVTSADGVIREQDAFDLGQRLQAADEATRDAWATDAAAAAARRGVTGIVDLEMTGAVETWGRRMAAGARSLRVIACVYPEGLDRVRATGLRTGEELPGSHGLATVGWFKLFTDGALNSLTAWCDDPYPSDGVLGGAIDALHGLPSYSDADLLAAARDALAAGIVPTIHAIGDRAVTQALDTFEALGIPAEAPARGRIEHVQLVRREDLPRFAHLDVTASVQPEHAMDDRDVADHHWEGRTDRSFAYRALLDAGARLEFGSDAPVAPLDPWATIAAAVTRSRDGREPWHPEQAVPLAAALRASWGGSGGVVAGADADLVVLDADPHAVSPEGLRTMPVHATLVAGEPTGSLG